MSEYTKYFVIKSSSELEVKKKLNDAEIISIVYVDKFSIEYKVSGNYSWVTASCPADYELDSNLQFTYKDQFENLKDIFDKFILFYQEENFVDWFIKIKYMDLVLEKKIYNGSDILFDSSEKEIFSKCFEKDFESMQPLLLPGKSYDFLSFVGIPYLELNDQDHIPKTIAKNDNYSFLADEVKD